MISGYWAQAATTAAPAPRFATSLVWDGVEHALLMIGGKATDVLNTTWRFEGQAWVQAAPLPSPRGWAATAWDSKRAVVVLFGGSTGTTVNLDETLEY